ncbi:MAG: hypothetical protein J0H68_03115 [Sphingobacteriia bacterium]|nr:hypothetical protein [Sphingobacteriia bacterium]
MEILTIENFLSFITILGIEIILGIDNLVFIVVAVHNLNTIDRERARNIGLTIAMFCRIITLFIAFYIKNLTKPLFIIFNQPISLSSILMILGGGFLTIKGFSELYDLKKTINNPKIVKVKSDFKGVILQIVFIDLVLSFDSIMAAIAVTDYMYLVVIAIIVTVIIMTFLSRKLGKLIYKYKSFRVLALATITLLGISLIFNGIGVTIARSSLYLAIFFAITFEVLRIYITEVNKFDSQQSN